MKKIIEVQVISSPSIAHFNGYLNDKIKDGFELYGSVLVTVDKDPYQRENRFLYTQTVVKYEAD